MIKLIFQKLHSLVCPPIQAPSNNEEPRIFPDDVFLVSYPKSGNTWLRFILANLLHKEANINFTNIHRYCLEMGRLDERHSSTKRPRLIKSHERFNPSFPRVVYIARDGRDVYVSYYHYLKNRLPAETSLKAFLKEPPTPFGRWADHVDSWLGNCTGRALLVIKYEDIYLNSISTVRKVIEFVGIEANDLDIKIALEKATFDKMKGLEVKHGRGKYKTGPDSFMRKGQLGDWRNYFGVDEKRVFKEKENQALIRLQYENDPNW